MWWIVCCRKRWGRRRDFQGSVVSWLKVGRQIMPVHDWTKVEAGVFHAFHVGWIATLQQSLNQLLPKDYYALAEQHAGEVIPDILTLQLAEPSTPEASFSSNGGGVAIAPARVGRRVTGDWAITAKGTPRTLSIRHISGHRLVAMIEIVSPANRDRRKHATSFISKGVAALGAGVHLMIVDLFPPGPFDKHGLSAMIWRGVVTKSKETTPVDKPLTIASIIS